MNINIKKFFTLFFTLVLCVSVFTVTAFAQSDPLMPDTPPAGETIEPGNGNTQTNPDEVITPPQEPDIIEP